VTTFKFNTVNLETLGNITVVDGYLDMPEKRGSNITIPYQHGTSFVTKFYDERTIQFGIAVIEASATALETQFATIRALFSTMEPKTLEVTMEDASVRTVLASCEKPLQVKRMSNKNARIIVELTLHRPFFRSDTLYTVDSDAIDGTPDPQTLTVVNGGTIEERDPKLILYGPLENPVITKTTPTPDVILTYTGVIDDGETVTIETAATGEYTATHNVYGNVIGNVTHSGSSALMVFEVGTNAVTIHDDNYDGGNAKLTVSFYTPFL
jgi:hypothetical protein